MSCRLQFECCTDAEIMAQYMGITYNDQPITTEAQCVEFTAAFFGGLAVSQYKKSIERGRIEYDADAAGECIAVANSASCAEFSSGALDDSGSMCSPFIIPLVADGGACTQNYECTSDNCVGATVHTEGEDIDGACEPLPAAGQTCDFSCADGLYCEYDPTAGMSICQPTLADGMDCTFDDDCTSENCDDTTNTCASEAPVCDGR